MVAGTRSAPARINIAMDAAMHARLPRWVKTRNYRSATAMAGSLSDNGHDGAKPTRAADVTVWTLWSADACAPERVWLQPRYRSLAHTIGSRQISLRSALHKPLDNFLALMDGKAPAACQNAPHGV
jgi:hypothetical protein